MPINKTIQVTEQRQVAIWYIKESFDQLLAMLDPNEEDKALVCSFKNKRKQLEWLSGRLTLKYLTKILGVDYQGIKKDDCGKPYLNNQSFEISLTHSYPYVAAIIDRDLPVGIDLEQPREKIVKLAHKFLNDQELDFAKNDVNTLNILWCAKETLYKIDGKKGGNFREEMHIEPFEKSNKGLITGNIIEKNAVLSYKLMYIVNNDYTLIYNK